MAAFLPRVRQRHQSMKKKKPITIQVGHDYGGYKVLDIELRFCGEYSKRRLLYGKFACPTCQTLNWTTCRAIAQWVARKTPWSCERCRTAARKSAKSSTANYAGSRVKQRAPCVAIRSPRAAPPIAAASVSATASPARKRPTGRQYIRALRPCLTSSRLTFGSGQFKSPRST